MTVLISKTSWSLPSAHQNLKVYIEVLTRFNHVFGSPCLDNTSLSQVYVFETAPTVSMVNGMYIPRTVERWGASSCPVLACSSASSHILSMTSSINWAHLDNQSTHLKAPHSFIFYFVFFCHFPLKMSILQFWKSSSFSFIYKEIISFVTQNLFF